MITPISNNLNAASSLSNIERPRVPRRMNAAYNINFTGKGKSGTGKIATGARKFFGGIINSARKGASSIRKGVSNVIHSKAVQAVKNGAVNGFHKTINFIRKTPKTIGNFFSKIGKKFSKKA